MKIGALIGTSLLCLLGCSPDTTKFSSKNGDKKPDIFGRDSQAAGEPFAVPAAPAGQCAGNARATRIVYVVDNSGSHAATVGATGSDPVVTATSSREKQEPLTQRQNAVWSAVVRTVETDTEAKQKFASYPGGEVGIVAFPFDESAVGYTQPVLVSGNGGKAGAVLPALMNSTISLKPTDTFKEGLWEGLKFTHESKGATPYTVGLQNARRIFDAGTNDTRLKVVVFITDGIPTDRSPQAVVDFANNELKDAVIVTVFVYTPGVDDLKATPAYASLNDAWTKNGWGKESGAASFDDYWNKLRKIPLTKAEGGMSTHLVEVRDSSLLKAEIEKVLGVVQSCGN